MRFLLRQITLIACVSGSILPGCDRLNKVIPIPVPQGVDGTTTQTETAAYSEEREPQPSSTPVLPINESRALQEVRGDEPVAPVSSAEYSGRGRAKI